VEYAFLVKKMIVSRYEKMYMLNFLVSGKLLIFQGIKKWDLNSLVNFVKKMINNYIIDTEWYLR
jgi:hypothetical protein